MSISLVRMGCAGLLGLGVTSCALGDVYLFNGSDGLSAEVEFTIEDGGSTLALRVKNTSTGVPNGFEASDQILTGISWDFGLPGDGGDPEITGGTVFTGPNSSSLYFSERNVGPNEDVSGEWGYGNMDGTGLLENFLTATRSQSIAFGGENLDGPVNINGPSGGLVANPLPLGLGGLGAIQDEVMARLFLSSPISNLDFLQNNGTLMEFGSDAAFSYGELEVPAPPVFAVFALAGLLGGRRRR